MKKIILTVIIAMFFLPVFVWAENLTFAVVEWPPIVIVNNGQIEGISVDITREVCKRIGIQPKFELLPLKRAFKYLKDGKICMASLFYNEKRDKFLYYPSEYQYNVRNVIIALKKNGSKVNHLDDLKDKNIGVITEYHYGDKFNNYQDFKRVQVRELSYLIKLLKNGRVDFIAAEENGFKYKCKQLNIQDIFEIVYTISEKPFYTVFPKKMGQRGSEIAEKFGNTLQQMRKEGVIQNIINKYH